MELYVLAVVEILFQSPKLEIKVLRVLEKLLRQSQTVDSLSIYGNRITFQIKERGKINYKILDQIKEKLKQIGCSEFAISAFEYVKGSKKYDYSSKLEKKSLPTN